VEGLRCGCILIWDGSTLTERAAFMWLVFGCGYASLDLLPSLSNQMLFGFLLISHIFGWQKVYTVSSTLTERPDAFWFFTNITYFWAAVAMLYIKNSCHEKFLSEFVLFCRKNYMSRMDQGNPNNYLFSSEILPKHVSNHKKRFF
jgi:hypothetical protein